METPLIFAQNLSKKFQSYKKRPGLKGSLTALFYREKIEKEAISTFSLSIGPGEIVGLLGPNGAGKTTLMKMFTGIIVPSSGELKVLEHNPWERKKEFRKKIALVMGQKSQLWWDIPAMDSFELLQKYYEVSPKAFKDRVEEMSTLLGVTSLLHVQVRKLSLGERMKMELMASLLHSPDVIFLDEPTIGLDLVAQENIRNFIKTYQQKNRCSIVITSHYMADVQALCSRLVLILDGKKGFDGPIGEFEKILGHEKNVTFTFATPKNPTSFPGQGFDPKWNDTHTQVELRLPEDKLRSMSAEIIRDWDVVDFSTEKMPIERVMKTLMADPKILFSKGPHAH